MSVIRLRSGELLLHSPCRPSEQLAGEIASLGNVAHVIAPNWFHDLYLQDYRQLYPGAVFWGCRRLRKHIDRTLDSGSAAPWSDELPHFTLSGLLTFDESIFFHRASGTLIVADLLMNVVIERDSPPFTRFGLGLFRVDGSVKIFPVLRWFGFGAVKASVDAAARQVAQWRPGRLIPGHGTPVAHISPEELENALSW